MFTFKTTRRTIRAIAFTPDNVSIAYMDDGDGLSGATIIATGLYVEDVVAGDFNVAQAASDDALDGDKLVAIGSMVFNPTAGDWDRAISVEDLDAASVGLPAVGVYLLDSATWNRWRTANNTGDGGVGDTFPPVALMARDIAAGDYNRIAVAADDGLNGDSILATACLLFNGTTFDRQQSGSAVSTDPHFAAGKVIDAGGTLELVASATQTTNFSGTVKTGLGGFKEIIVTLDITVTDRADANETYDFFITTGDGVASWDLIHFTQIVTTGTHRFTAKVQGNILPQNVTTAGPGVSAVETSTLDTILAGADQGIRTLGVGLVRHGVWGDRINHELVVAGTTPSITYSITITVK